MCLLFLYLNESDTEDGYKLILANNRDEDLPRPTGTVAFRGSDSQWIGGTCWSISFKFIANVLKQWHKHNSNIKPEKRFQNDEMQFKTEIYFKLCTLA